MVTAVLLRSVFASLIVIAVVAMIEVDLLAIMAWWNISLNAVSVVNLVVAIGISVEFCAHITHAFMNRTGTRDDRVFFALTDMGSSLLSGITFTKFIGVRINACGALSC